MKRRPGMTMESLLVVVAEGDMSDSVSVNVVGFSVTNAASGVYCARLQASHQSSDTRLRK